MSSDPIKLTGNLTNGLAEFFDPAKQRGSLIKDLTVLFDPTRLRVWCPSTDESKKKVDEDASSVFQSESNDANPKETQTK